MDDVIVDAHVHFWDPRAMRYPWLEHLPVLERPFTPDDYAGVTDDVRVEKLLVVECDCERDGTMREVEFFERLAEVEPRIGGIVAFVDLTNAAARERTLEALSRVASVKGIRHNIQGEAPGFCVDPTFVEGVRRVGECGFTFDLCVTHDQLGDVIELVRACPDTQFVLDHCGKPAIRDQRFDPWRDDITRLSEVERVSCKISGLLTEADHRRWREEDIMPYATHVVDCFGTTRVMYGSDWPVLTLAGAYADWFELSQTLVATWSDTERRAFYHDNAVRTYAL